MADEELFDICDAEDRVIGVAPRSEVHAKNWLHRAVHVFVFNLRGELLTHLRSATKDQYPSTFTSSASGHVSSGESYESSVERELWEELGLRGELEFLAKFSAGPETCYEHTQLYRLVTEAVPTPDPEEIAAIEWLPLSEVADQLKRQPERFSPCYRTLLTWYLSRESH